MRNNKKMILAMLVLCLCLIVIISLLFQSRPNTAGLVGDVRASEMWMYDFNSLHVHIQGNWAITSQEIDKRRQDIKEKTGIDDPNEKQFPTLRKTHPETLELAADRKRFRYLKDNLDSWQQIKIWDGNEYKEYNKNYNNNKEGESYIFDSKIPSTQSTFASYFGWPRSQQHHFWWNPQDVNMTFWYGQPEQFKLISKQTFWEIPCYVLEYTTPEENGNPITFRWFVGQSSHLLHKIQQIKDNQIIAENWMLNYREVVPGGWFPMQTGWSIYDINQHFLRYSIDYKVTEFRLNEPLKDDLFKMILKEGVEVQDNRSGELKIYNQPG
jgi:hypothetical protein